MGTTLSAIMTDTQTVLTSGISMAGDVINFITSHPLICVPVLFGFAGFGVGLLRRVFNW